MKETTFASISFSSFLASFRKSTNHCNADNHKQSHSVKESVLNTTNESKPILTVPCCRHFV